MNDAKWENLGNAALCRADMMGAVVEEVGKALCADRGEVTRLAQYTSWIFGEGAQYGLDLCRRAQAEKRRDRSNIDPENIKLDDW